MYFWLSDSSRETSFPRLSGDESARKVRSSSGGGRSPCTSRYARRAKTASETGAGSTIPWLARYLAVNRSIGAVQAFQVGAGALGTSNERGASHLPLAASPFGARGRPS